MNKDVVAVIVTYNRKELLGKVIDAVTNQSYPLKKILIIDNDSSDGTKESVLDKLSSVVDYINTGGNLGGAGGFHFGFQEAKKYDYDYLWLMDDDLLPDRDCLQNLLNVNNTGITQPMRFNIDGSCAEISPVEYDLASPFLINPKKSTVKDLYDSKPFFEPLIIAGVPFEGPLISRELIECIGEPDPRFFIFNDDLDYSIRARNAGYRIICQPSAVATRLLVNNQSNDLKSWKGYFMLRNHFYILRKYGESFFVKVRPITLTVGYVLLCVIRGQSDVALTTLRAYKDSFTLDNNEKYRP